MQIAERGFGKMNLGMESMGTLQERGYHIGTYQAKLFCRERGIELQQYLDEVNTFKFENTIYNNDLLATLIYSALAAYDTFMGAAIDYTPVQVSFWLGVAPIEEVAKFFHTLGALAADTPKK